LVSLVVVQVGWCLRDFATAPEWIPLFSRPWPPLQLELARLKRRKLMLKDRIQIILDSNVPDIIA